MTCFTKLALFGLAVLAAEAAVVRSQHGLDARDGKKPGLEYDPATTKYCTFWWDNIDDSVSCEDIPSATGITMDQWKRWVSLESCRFTFESI